MTSSDQPACDEPLDATQLAPDSVREPKPGRDTSERFIDREALRYASMRAGLEPGESAKVLSEWMTTAMVRAPRTGIVQFVAKPHSVIHEGTFDGRHFRTRVGNLAFPELDVLRWRYVW
jgi:hypothetical protein